MCPIFLIHLYGLSYTSENHFSRVQIHPHYQTQQRQGPEKLDIKIHLNRNHSHSEVEVEGIPCSLEVRGLPTNHAINIHVSELE